MTIQEKHSGWGREYTFIYVFKEIMPISRNYSPDGKEEIMLIQEKHSIGVGNIHLFTFFKKLCPSLETILQMVK